MMPITQYTDSAIQLLQQLIAIPSFSKEEGNTAKCIKDWFFKHGITAEQHLNNIYARNQYWQEGKPTLLLNSHHDTVRPADGWLTNPFQPILNNDKLIGLGSNDAGASLCALMHTFLHFYNQVDLPWNIILAATAEEEISGTNGIASILPLLGSIDCAIVGEPTAMQLAVAEKGLLVLDCETKGITGHAAHDKGINAIEIAVDDIHCIRTIQFPKKSKWLGAVKLTTTIIQAGNQHNIIPDQCKFTIDVRLNECYQPEEIIEYLQQQLKSKITPRSLRLRPSSISLEHPLVKAGIELGAICYGSPTLSDQALIPVPSLKCGPGDSSRSHTANEYITINELQEGISGYIELLTKFFNHEYAIRNTNLAEKKPG